MNENINLCEILKDCPEGTKFYSSTHGTVTLGAVRADKIIVLDYRNFPIDYSKDGRYCPHIYGKGECTIFPSKEQRDWSKWKCPKPKKPKFDPKTLKAFDKVLSRYDGGCWSANLFSHIEERDNEYCAPFSVCNGSLVKFCIPYNEETKHLVGTSDEAPEYYRYWED